MEVAMRTISVGDFQALNRLLDIALRNTLVHSVN
jgi:hypothetical protein